MFAPASEKMTVADASIGPTRNAPTSASATAQVVCFMEAPLVSFPGCGPLRRNPLARAPRSRSYSRLREGASEMHVRSAGLFQWDDEKFNAAILSEFPRAVFDCLENGPTPTGKHFPSALAQAGQHLRESPLRRGHARDPPTATTCWRGLAPRLAHRAASTARWT